MDSAKPQNNRPGHSLRSGRRDRTVCHILAHRGCPWMAHRSAVIASLPDSAWEHAPWREKARGRTCVQNSWVPCPLLHFTADPRGEWSQQRPVGLKVVLTGNAAGGKTARGVVPHPSVNCQSQAFPLNSPFHLKMQGGLLNIPETLYFSADILLSLLSSLHGASQGAQFPLLVFSCSLSWAASFD